MAVCLISVGLGLSSELLADSDAAVDALRNASPSDVAIEPVSPNVAIDLRVYPPVRAAVWWGQKQLGVIASRGSLTVQRPRDSGPLDLMVRAQGYLPVQTRAHTFDDGKLEVKLTPVHQIDTLLGYREPVDAGAASSEDVSTRDGGFLSRLKSWFKGD